MSARTLANDSIIVPSEDLAAVRQVAQAESMKISVCTRLDEGYQDVPRNVTQLVEEILHVLSRDGSVRVMRVPEELTSTAAAELIGISRPTLIQRAKEGVIPFRQVGTHKRFSRQDVMAYIAEIRTHQRDALDDLHAFYDSLEDGVFLD